MLELASRAAGGVSGLIGPVRGPPGQDVVRGEGGARAGRHEACVELWERCPLDVQDVVANGTEPGEPGGVLAGLEGKAERRAARDARAERVEELSAHVAVGYGSLAEAES